MKLSLGLLTTIIHTAVLASDYCQLQSVYCVKHKHIACSKNEFHDSSNWTHFEMVPMTSGMRADILEYVNDYRNRIAMGKIPGFPTASNLFALGWHWEFEYLMEESVQKANHGHFYCVNTDQHLYPYESSFQVIGNYTFAEVLARAMKRFTKNQLRNPSDRSFSVFYNSKIKQIACAYARYAVDGKQRHVLKCLLNNWTQATLAESYETGDPCDKCDCDSFYSGLCVEAFTGSPGPRGPPGPKGVTGGGNVLR